MSLFHECALDIKLLDDYLSIDDIKSLSIINKYYYKITHNHLKIYRSFFNKNIIIKHIDVPYITLTVPLETCNKYFIAACDDNNLVIAKYLFIKLPDILNIIVGSKLRHTYDPCKLYEYLIIRGIYTQSKTIIEWLLSFNPLEKSIIDRIIDNQISPELLYIFGQYTDEKQFYNACWNGIIYDTKIFLPLFYKYAINGLKLAKHKKHTHIVQFITTLNFSGYFLYD